MKLFSMLLPLRVWFGIALLLSGVAARAADPYGLDVIYGDERFQFSISQTATTSSGAPSNHIKFQYFASCKYNEQSAYQGLGWIVYNYNIEVTHSRWIWVDIGPNCSMTSTTRATWIRHRQDGFDYINPYGQPIPPPENQDTGVYPSDNPAAQDFIGILSNQSAPSKPLSTAEWQLVNWLLSSEWCNWYNLLNDPCWFRSMNGAQGPLWAMLIKKANPTWTPTQIKNYDPNGSGIPWWRNRAVFLNTHWSSYPSTPNVPTDNVSLWMGNHPFSDLDYWGTYHQKSPLIGSDGNTYVYATNNIADDTGIHCPDEAVTNGGTSTELGQTGGLGGIVSGGGGGVGSGGTTPGIGTGANTGAGGVPTGAPNGTDGTPSSGGVVQTLPGTAGGATSGAGPVGPATAGGNKFGLLVGSWSSFLPTAQSPAVVTFDIPWTDNTTQTFTFSSIPSGGAMNTALNGLRVLVRTSLTIFIVWMFLQRVYRDCVQY